MPAPTTLSSSSLVGKYNEFEVGKEPWSSESFMIVPLQSQILLNESAEFLAAKTFLKMTRLPYSIREMSNATSISPNGKLPVLRSGAYLVSEMDGIVQHVQSKNSGLTDHLNSTQKADLRAFCSLVHNVLGTSLQYFTWIDDEVFKKSTKERVGSPYNFPLNVLLPWSLRRKMKSQLGSLKWAQMKVSEVYEKLGTCFSALSERLGDTEYFFGSSPTELDALVFGYLFTMLTSHSQLPKANDELSSRVKQHTNLVMFCRRIDDEFFIDSGVLDG